MEKIKWRNWTAETRTESWQEKYEGLREQVKELEQSNTEKENEIKALSAKNEQFDDEVEKLEHQLADTKHWLKTQIIKVS